MTDSSRVIAVKPIIKYPREAQVGKTYLMTIDLQPEEGFEWQYEEEEYPIYCMVDSNLYNIKSVGEPVIVLHRFGGSYGEAKFLLTAFQVEQEERFKIIFTNQWGVVVKTLSLFSAFSDNDYITNEILEQRWETLLKRRLKIEIHANLPLFPWESEPLDYEAGTPDSWFTQLQSLNLPVALPAPVLEQLFQRCQITVQSPLRENIRLVQAVEDLFPGQSQELNNLARLVVAPPARSGAVISEGVPNSYEAASTAQQMALSLIAAREILDLLTLRSGVVRQWQTAAGLLSLRSEITQERVCILAQIPCGGRLRLQGSLSETSASRSTRGSLSVELLEPELNRVYLYLLEVQLEDKTALMFAVQTSGS